VNYLLSFESLFSPLSLIILYLGVILVFAESLNRFTHLNAEFTRKVVHIGTGHVILLAWWLQIPAWIGIFASILASFIALISYFIPILPSINSVGRQSLGTFFYAISIGLLVAWFWDINQPQYAAIGILVMAWGDGMAAIIGQKFGKHSYQVLGCSKSWEGSLTMMGVSFMVIFLILFSISTNVVQIVLISATVALFATSLETISKLGMDNLTVPLGSAALSFWLNQL
jgi:phytol kinase